MRSFGEPAFLREVAVLHPVAHLLGRAGAGIDADVRLGADPAAPLDELAGAEGVGVLDPPGFVVGGSSRRADAVLPVVAGGEASAGPAHDGDAQFAQRLDDIEAKAPGVGELGAGLEDAAVHLAVEMLQELAEQHAVVGDEAAGGIDADAGAQRRGGGSPRNQHSGGALEKPASAEHMT